MVNTINTLENAPGLVAKMAAKMFKDNNVFCQSIDQAPATDYNGKNGYSSGDTIQISKPARFDVGTDADITSSIQGVTEEKVSLDLDTRAVVAIELTSREIATDMALKEWAGRILKPAVNAMANDVEKRFLAKAVDATANSVGTAGSTVFDTDTMLAAREKMNLFLAPDMDRYALLGAAAERSAVVERNGLFQSSEQIAKQYEKGVMGIADGFKYKTNQLLPIHTNGNDVTGVNIDGAAQTGSTLNLQGFTTTTGTLTQGSVFTIAGVNAVHPITKEDIGELQQFTVSADATADGSGDIAASIYPSIIATGSTRTVSALPADAAALTFVGAASTGLLQNLAFQKSAFRMVSVPLVKPDGVDMAAQETVDGITMRVIRDYDVLTDKLIMRLDFLGGLAATRPEWACRITA